MNAPEMIPCDHVIARLWEYIDGGLEAGGAAEVEAHLDVCARCFPEYNFRRAYRSFLQQVGSRSMPPEVKHRVFEAILEEERRGAVNGAGPASGGYLGRLRERLRRFFASG